MHNQLEKQMKSVLSLLKTKYELQTNTEGSEVYGTVDKTTIKVIGSVHLMKNYFYLNKIVFKLITVETTIIYEFYDIKRRPIPYYAKIIARDIEYITKEL